MAADDSLCKTNPYDEKMKTEFPIISNFNSVSPLTNESQPIGSDVSSLKSSTMERQNSSKHSNSVKREVSFKSKKEPIATSSHWNEKQRIKERGREFIDAMYSSNMDILSQTLSSLRSMSSDHVPLEEGYFTKLGGHYKEFEDETEQINSDIARYQKELSQIHEQMGKGNLPKCNEPSKGYDSTLWDDILGEMKDFQDLVDDEHKEKRKKFKALILATQKHFAKLASIKLKEKQEENKLKMQTCKNISSIIDIFWKKIEIFAWERLKRDLQAQLVEKKRLRLDKFIEDAIKMSASQDEAKIIQKKISNIKRQKSAPSVAGDIQTISEEPSQIESKQEPGDNLSDDDFNISEEMKKMEKYDQELEMAMEQEEEENTNPLNELSALEDDANIPIEEIIKRYESDAMNFKQSSEPEPISDAEDEYVMDTQMWDNQERDDLDLDNEMSTDEEDKVNPLTEISALEDDTNMPIEELIKRYGLHNQSDNNSVDDDYDSNHTSVESGESLPSDKGSDCETDETEDDLESNKSPNEVQIPSLIRANLRPYQLEGLRWLAKLYDKGLNGILADEMGLGKTLQAICLLAFLACERGNWGPHLIVVPTSVLLNWVMEFQKFCPGFKILAYYGTPAERAKKRVGWNQPYSFNVCIASYSTVVQDAFIMKRKSWVYMILDEAQNIKNFNSKRWQTLLTFNTVGRLLLTGTPLQNSLQELWSLMHFILPEIFSSHSEFKEWFSDPLTEAIECEQITSETGGKDGSPNELVTKLHAVFRPYLLRRLKKDVEKQMPSKYEHVVKCYLTRRQKVLYDEFMSSRTTTETLANRDHRKMFNVLVHLRKICNHPDQLDSRPVESPYLDPSLVPDVVIPSFLEIPDVLNAKLYHRDIFTVESVEKYYKQRRYPVLPLSPHLWKGKESQFKYYRGYSYSTNNYNKSIYEIPVVRRKRPLKFGFGSSDLSWDPILIKELSTSDYCAFSSQKYLKVNDGRKLSPKKSVICETKRELLELGNYNFLNIVNNDIHKNNRWKFLTEPTVDNLVDKYWWMLHNFTCLVGNKVRCVPRKVYLSGSGGIRRNQRQEFLISQVKSKFFRGNRLEYFNNAKYTIEHAHSLQKLLFPPKRLLNDDCGKFLVLGKLLKQLKSEGHRCLLYTQFSKMLDVLENWINYLGLTYIRLDGSTKVDMRQRIVTRFNENNRIFLFISSTRAGGVGLTLTGADTVIFYDTDWNPAMDRQAMDRCHRIGQTREVNVYRLITEHTVEENIWRKQLQKRRLDDIVVDKGKFNTGENWFSSVDVLLTILKEKNVSGEEDIYGKKVLHESETPDDTQHIQAQQSGHSSQAMKLLIEAEDADDSLALKHMSKETESIKNEFQMDFKADLISSIPALVTYCIQYLLKYQTPKLVSQVQDMNIRIQAEEFNSDEKESLHNEESEGYDDEESNSECENTDD
ncbi:helicase family member protein [Theileria equi strain WA]|uniref:Helicase family member protein n=1 Tax=Theileria equi strain WA TaxID=1537102 RepID=L1LGA3_THEEQ|nr:helicase family member protein [Theileria equi strain WA]EKX74294.1 helicase family member protein [Theileria equi strain WA]|eukprot:XP_004833746.1 helicase family member protein [Theileria equi strain WA]